MESEMINLIVEYGPDWLFYLLQSVGGIVLLVSAVVKATKTKKDDEWLKGVYKKFGGVLCFLERFSLIRK